jgi:hypothetical protein
MYVEVTGSNPVLTAKKIRIMNWTFFALGLCLGILANIDTISQWISDWIEQ